MERKTSWYEHLLNAFFAWSAENSTIKRALNRMYNAFNNVICQLQDLGWYTLDRVFLLDPTVEQYRVLLLIRDVLSILLGCRLGLLAAKLLDARLS